MEGLDGKSGVTESYAPRPAGTDSDKSSGAGSAPEVTGINEDTAAVTTVEEVQASKKGWFAYFKTRDFYIVLVLGYVLTLCSCHFAADRFIQSNPCPVHHFHQYFLFATSRRRHLHSSIPDLL